MYCSDSHDASLGGGRPGSGESEDADHDPTDAVQTVSLVRFHRS